MNRAASLTRTKLIVGLGNPGSRYRHTRHNVGFMALEELARQLGAEFSREKYKGLVAETGYGAAKLVLLKPLTFVNRSGESVERAVRYRVRDLADLLVILDDIHLPLGKLRLRAQGSAGGHNGLQSIIDRLSTDAFPRLRIGIGWNRRDTDLTAHVLGAFTPEEAAAIRPAIREAAEAALEFASGKMEHAMDRFNRKGTFPNKVDNLIRREIL